MGNLTDQQISEIIEKTVKCVLHGTEGEEEWLCRDADTAVANAQMAQRQLAAMSLEKRREIVESMRRAAVKNAEGLAKMACMETGYGRVEHKTLKNILAAEKTPGTEVLETYAVTGDFGLTIVENAPFGVIGSITPSTNPVATVINNSISMIAAGNAVVFNPHPAARKCSQETMRILNCAACEAGGPDCLMTTVAEPTLASGQAIMEHRDIAILSVTGGEAVVKAAMKSGKKVIAAGPGNPPVIVDDTASIKKAAKDIVDGASFDNNIMCIAEKEVFAFSTIIESLMDEMCKNGAVRITGSDIDKVLRTVLIQKNGKHVINRDFVGKSAAHILLAAGVPFAGDPRLVICEVEKTHPFIMTEMMMPVLGIARVMDIGEAIACALYAEQGYRHSAMIHSTNVKHLTRAAVALNTTIFVKNAPSYAGDGFMGEGHSTFTIATPTGEGMTCARTFTRSRRCVLQGDFRIL